MKTIKQLAADSRNTETAVSPPGSQRGVCTGVYQVGRGSRTRLIARILLAGGLAVTAYLPAGMAAPALDSTVQVSTPSGGDCPTCRVQVVDPA